jgi:amino-acid N-acetyltransferase
MPTQIRKALLADSETIHSLIQTFAKEGLMLARSFQYIVEHIRDFYVAVDDQTIVGCCAFTVSQKELAEIKSLAIHPDYHHQGLARTLITAGIKDLTNLGIERVFCLTYVPDFFKKLGFTPIEKETLPHKIWTECINCPSFPDCGEIALIKPV